MTTREQVARAICCGEHGRCILEDCEPADGELTACIALKGYHDKTIEAVLALSPPEPTEGLLPIFADGGLGSRLLHAAETYARDEYVFSPDEGSDHEPTEFERMLFEDMINGLFAHEPFAAILQEAARSIPLQDHGSFAAYDAALERAAQTAIRYGAPPNIAFEIRNLKSDLPAAPAMVAEEGTK